MIVWPLHPSVAVGLVILTLTALAVLLAALRVSSRTDDLMAVADAVQGPPFEYRQGPTLLVAQRFEIARTYARREGLSPRDYRVATNAEAMRGHRGPIVVVDGERSSFPIDLPMHDALAHLRAIGCPVTWDAA